jgi:hypothetical protein
LEGG